jgi:hypothetical protein
MTVIEYKGFRIEVSPVGKGCRAAIFAPRSTRPLADSPSNTEKTEEVVTEAKRVIDARLGPRQASFLPASSRRAFVLVNGDRHGSDENEIPIFVSSVTAKDFSHAYSQSK